MIDAIVILSGASRGLGAALALAACRPGTLLVTLSRGEHPLLAQHARRHGCEHRHYAVDLADPVQTETVARGLFADLPDGAGRYRLINNAGTVEPIAQAAVLDAAAVAHALHVNVAAAMLLTAAFLGAAPAAADRRVLNISSGAGQQPMAGWSVYCATKAALDMYTRTVRLEQQAGGLRIAALSPGVIDTPMQARIRATLPDAFPAVEDFKTLHRSGQLAAPADVAARILDYLERDDFGQNELDDIRQY
ncbi:short-chain dehydrogenase [Pigmentiphaga sp. NML080357]|uniref:SDR family oxidoreductase n=1 Tax=Pigmentiphaga sp. NML080357 TaxID=2008675 RepID=UPI000B4151C7|nr:SDR family oxidoreductase [Pigmentiphaga sp. NML080357]OVZ58352.1 short-chain dehydrogenase [Pigmentiphaga sp. NML080357]